jgi:hypothetical protein
MVLRISAILSCEEDALIVNGTEPWRLPLSEVEVVNSTQIGRFFFILETTDERKCEITFERADIAEGNHPRLVPPAHVLQARVWTMDDRIFRHSKSESHCAVFRRW